MKRCRYCKKFVWPWQNQWLGTTPAHAECAFVAFVRRAYAALPAEVADRNVMHRKAHSYRRPL